MYVRSDLDCVLDCVSAMTDGVLNGKKSNFMFVTLLVAKEENAMLLSLPLVS